MTGNDLLVLSPLLLLAGSAVIVMLASAFRPRHGLVALLSLVGLIGALVSLPLIWSEVPRQITPQIIMDGPAIFYLGLLFVTAFVVIVQGYGYFQNYDGESRTFYTLILLATLGAAVLVASSHFASFFLGLETLSISLYALIAYTRRERERVEASLKYLILAGTTSAFLLFGMAMIYSETGSLSLEEIAGAIESSSSDLIFLLGAGLLVVGIAFKLALVPFHLWTPDVYQGAPAPITGFIATVSKGGMFVLLIRYFYEMGLMDEAWIAGAFGLIAVASMLVGNLLAVLQSNVKRMLAYSSIAHLGYLLIPFVAFNDLSIDAVALYLAAYFLTTLCAFGVVSMLSAPQEDREDLRDYEGLFWQQPTLSVIFMLALLSLAGLPPLAGLVAKIYLVTAGIASQLWILLAALTLGSIIGVYYYVRVIIVMVRRGEDRLYSAPAMATPGGFILLMLAILLVVLGLYPTPLLQLISSIFPALS